MITVDHWIVNVRYVVNVSMEINLKRTESDCIAYTLML